jgi:MarR family transcriptional regulator, organic hydroperoxide resistance regulator
MTKTNPDALRELIQAFIHRFGLLDQTRTPCGLSISVSDAHALMELLKTPNIDQMNLSKRLGLSKSATTRLVQRLKRRGQISRCRNQLDGRAYNLNLTDKGKRQAEMINRESLKIFGAIISGLSEDAAQQLMQSIPLLIKAIPEFNRNSNSEFIQV